MKIEEKQPPLIFEHEGKTYSFIKKYPNYYLYEDVKIKTKACFKADELDLFDEIVPGTRKVNPY